MNDDQIPELLMRVSAYLDGELDAVEMSRLAADPVAMAEVEQLRGLQAALRDVEPPSDAAREGAIAAALREFDGPAMRGAVERPATVVPFRPRPSYARWLTAAAAVVGVGVLGVVATQGMGGSDDDSAGIAADAIATAEDTTQQSARSAEATMSSELAVAEEPIAADAGDVATSTASTLAGDAEVFGESSGVGTTADLPPFDPGMPITDESALYQAGQRLLAAFADGNLLTPDTECSFPIGTYEILDEGIYVDRPAIIVADPATDETLAIDPDTCATLAVAARP